MIGKTNVKNIGGSYSPTKAFINVTTPSKNLYGQLVACSYETEKGTQVLTGVFDETGTCVFAVPELTTYTIICDYLSTIVKVTEAGSVVNAEIVHSKAVLNLTTSNLNGEVVTVSVGESAYTGIFVDGVCKITVYEYGTATITCSETTVTQVVEADKEYTVDVTEITAVYYIEDGVLKNGASWDTTKSNEGVTWPVTFSYSSNYKAQVMSRQYDASQVYLMIKGTSDSLAGKTLYVTSQNHSAVYLETYDKNGNQKLTFASNGGYSGVNSASAVIPTFAGNYFYLRIYANKTTGYVYNVWAE